LARGARLARPRAGGPPSGGPHMWRLDRPDRRARACPGRRTVRVRVGLDIGGTTIEAVALGDGTDGRRDGEHDPGHVLAEHAEPTTHGPEGVVTGLGAAYGGLLAQLEAPVVV